ncbi:MAG: recombinase family protein, partial [Roseovarius sp.]|nr:recombinase family protein [Roseovarius sp.]
SFVAVNAIKGAASNRDRSKVNEVESETIRTLYDLYEQHGTVREVKITADTLGLRSKQRVTAAGKQTGGVAFDRGHIHHLLTNPIYAGRIRHKTTIHDGQHDAIIDPDRWDRIQEQLQDGAAKGKAGKTAKQKSLLCSKIFDETGDRLTPSHTKTKSGVRLRYYVSHRLIKRSGEADKDGWRLPADDLEQKVAHIVRQRIAGPSFVGSTFPDATAEMIRTARATLQSLGACNPIKPVLDLVARIDLRPGELRVIVCAERLAGALNFEPEAIAEDALTLSAPFQLRKRGVETKLVFADEPGNRDEVLIRNIAMAHCWYQQIKDGKTISEIAAASGTSNQRVQQMIELAFLAPNVVKDVLNGQQPSGFTSNWFKQLGLPTGWQDQRDLLATL